MTSRPQSISVDHIFLDLKNPRHEPYRSEEEVIDYLCRNEYVYALAKDMVEIGLNPLELFALIPLKEERKRGALPRYVVAEGNRRLCAIKLLRDPELAPADFRKDFRRLAESAQRVSEVLAVIFDNEKQVSAWLERIHGGVQGGVGRKPWNPEQKTRHIGDRKNLLAQTVLDYAEKRGFISANERKGRLTTAQRYLGNAFVREAIGIESSSLDSVSRNRPAEDFDLLLQRFVRDLVDNTVHSRSNADTIKDYARTISGVEGLTNKRVAAESLAIPAARKKQRRNPKEPAKPKSITFDGGIEDGLKRIGSYKLQKLYFSICDVGLDKHTPLISVGVWSFFETLTARCGRTTDVPFPNYLSKAKLTAMGFTDRDRTRPITLALERLSAYGNTTKHHDTSANFNGEQLANDIDTLGELIHKLIAEVKS